MNQLKSANWGLPAVLGAFLMILGGIAIAVPLLATLEIAWIMGALFIMSGVAQLFHVSDFNPRRSKAYRLLIAALSLVAGFFILRNPITGALAITLVMSFYFLAVSVARAALAFEMPPGRGKGWLAFSAGLSLLLGLYLVSTLPKSSLVIPGLFLGMDLVIYGATLIALGATLRRRAATDAGEWPTKAA